MKDLRYNEEFTIEQFQQDIDTLKHIYETMQGSYSEIVLSGVKQTILELERDLIQIKAEQFQKQPENN